MLQDVKLTVGEFLKEFAVTPAGRALLRDRAKREFGARQAAVDKLHALRSELVVAAETRDATLGPLEAAAQVAQKEAERAALALLAKREQYKAQQLALENQCARLEYELRTSADVRIDEARRAIGQRWEALRGTACKSKEVKGDQRNENGDLMWRSFNNRRAIARVVEAIGVARVSLERLKLENPENVEAAIADVEATIPWGQLDELEPA